MHTKAETGNEFPLDAFETAVRSDTEIIGALYTGSLGRGTADRYSDLDIDLWVTGPALEAASARLRALLGRLATVQFMYERGEAFATGFVGPDWQRVDLELHHQSETEPSPKYAKARIVKDTNSALARIAAQSPPETASAAWDQARAAIEEAIDSQLYLSLHNARGAVWSAMGEVSYQSAQTYTLLALLRGYQSFGFRYVEQILSPSEQDILRAAWPREPERQEVRRSARALWVWTRHVWHEAERTLGRTLDIHLDEAQFLAAIDRNYTQTTERPQTP